MARITRKDLDSAAAAYVRALESAGAPFRTSRFFERSDQPVMSVLRIFTGS